MGIPHIVLVFFFFNDTATTEIYTLSLHDALPISSPPNHHSIHVPSSAHVRPHAAYSNCPKICTESLELGRLTLGKYLRRKSLALTFNLAATPPLSNPSPPSVPHASLVGRP